MTIQDTDVLETVEPETILFFAYGTLRKGEALYDSWIKEIIVNDLGDAKLRFAKLFYLNEHKHYPVCVWTGRFGDEAVGEVFEVLACDKLADLLQMEAGAGYRLSEGEVEFPDGKTQMAMICTWDLPYGNEVPKNDWLSEERKKWW